MNKSTLAIMSGKPLSSNLLNGMENLHLSKTEKYNRHNCYVFVKVVRLKLNSNWEGCGLLGVIAFHRYRYLYRYQKKISVSGIGISINSDIGIGMIENQISVSVSVWNSNDIGIISV